MMECGGSTPLSSFVNFEFIVPVVEFTISYDCCRRSPEKGPAKAASSDRTPETLLPSGNKLGENGTNETLQVRPLF